MNNEAIDFIASKDASLIITVDCGISNAKEIAYAKEKGIELRALSNTKRPEYSPLPDVHDIFVDETVEAEIYAQKLQGALAASLGCPPDAIDVVMYVDDNGDVSIQYVQVFLDLHTAKKISRLDI